ncbi:GNAT family N-acetyltransferase [Chloroflexota bacterium]
MNQNKGDIKIRKMVEADLPKVNEIDRSLFSEQRAPTWGFSFESYWQVYRPDIHFVAELEGEIVGFVVGTIVEEAHNHSVTNLTHTLTDFNKHRWIGWIDMIGINPKYQRRGIGRALIEAFHAECKRNNAVMRGVTRENDERLNNFLLSMGFRKWDIANYEKL